MSNPISAAIRIGTLGELLVQLRLLQFDVQAAPPLKDSGNDLIAVKGPRFHTIQVKTTANRRVPDFPDNRIYSLLAIVRLVGEDRDIRLDESELCRRIVAQQIEHRATVQDDGYTRSIDLHRDERVKPEQGYRQLRYHLEVAASNRRHATQCQYDGRQAGDARGASNDAGSGMQPLNRC
jgi:hypothetical protein